MGAGKNYTTPALFRILLDIQNKPPTPTDTDDYTVTNFASISSFIYYELGVPLFSSCSVLD
jgi:hypothetical protein